jgi:hypothetical protein
VRSCNGKQRQGWLNDTLELKLMYKAVIRFGRRVRSVGDKAESTV